MKTFASLFTGGGGADIGAMQAGYKPIWGVEYIPEIAEVCQGNLHHPVIVKSLLDVDPAELVSPDWLHMSPPCPNFSVAKAGGEETENDLALARKMVEFIDVLKSPVVSLENVWGYRNSQSWQIVLEGLNKAGYRFDFWHLNSADYGVPQTRKRLVLVAKRAGAPVKPNATHTASPVPLTQLTMFDTRLDRWVSWCDSIADLLDELPASQFAPWQLDRLPEGYKSLLISSTEQRIPKPYVEDAPMFTVSTGHSLPRAFLVDPNNTSSDLTTRNNDEPVFTIVANQMRRESAIARAFIADGQPSSNGEKMTVRGKDDPIHTVQASQYKKMHTAFIGRVVAMTPRCLARFQSFPDWYELPERKALACRIIGNAVPPLLMQRVMEAQL